VYQSIVDTCRPIINIFTLSLGEDAGDVGSMKERIYIWNWREGGMGSEMK